MFDDTTKKIFFRARSQQVKDFQNKLTEFLTTRRAPLLAKIQKEKALSDALIAELKAAATEFKQTYK